MFTRTQIVRAATVIAAAGTMTASVSSAPALLISQGTSMYRYQGGSVSTFAVGDVINGMTNVPAGMTVGNMNGGATAGDVVALGGSAIYRVDNALTSPTLTQIGVRGGPNASPVFVGNRMFGVAGVLPQGSIVVEWDPNTFAEINRWTTGVFGGPGGIVNVPGTPDEFYYSEFNTDLIYHYKLGDTFSTPVCSTPNNDYVGLEMIGNTIYASYALPGTGQLVLGTQSLTGAFNQLAVLDVYHTGITGIAQLVPSPGAVCLFGCALSVVGMRRRRFV